VNVRDEIARIITAGLSQGVTVDDLNAAQRGDQSIGLYMADALIARGFTKGDPS
jgi:hypothetical protein